MFKILLLDLIFLFVNYSLASQNVDSSNKSHSSTLKKIASVNKGQYKTSVQNYDLTNVLPAGFVKDGSIDYTTYIQKGIDEYTNVLMPNFPILINEEGLSVRSNSSIEFKPHSALLMKPNSLVSYTILKIFNVSNVEIQSPVIVGERNQHKGDKGEWGMGIHIQAAKNVKISSPSISNCWGDGIYIGGDVTNSCENIKITDAKIDNCRRNGISITDGKNIQIINPTISNIHGTAPMAGIDIEPNNERATIDNILISNPITLNSENFGIIISLGELPAEISKNVKIKIDNHIDKQSKTAFCIAGFRGKYENKAALSGLIEVNNPKWYNNKQTLLTGIYHLGPKTQFKNIKIYKDEEGTKNRLSQKDVLIVKKEQSINRNIIIAD